MSANFKENPFIALFGSTINAERYINKIYPNGKNNSTIADSNLLESILLVSTRLENYSFPCIILEDVGPLEPSNIDTILFERLMLSNLHSNLKGVSNCTTSKEDIDLATRDKALIYLAEVYSRSKQVQNSYIKKLVLASVIRIMKTIIQQPDVIENQSIHNQFQDMILNDLYTSKDTSDLLMNILNDLHEENDLCTNLLKKILDEVQNRLKKCSLMGIDWSMISVIDFFASSSTLAPFLLTPVLSLSPSAAGHHYTETVLGSLLSISCLPKIFGDKCEFFENPSRQSGQNHKAMESSIGLAQKTFQNRIYLIFLSLLKVSHEVKHLLLQWIEHCLLTNSGRSGLWHIQAEEFRAMEFVPDGFMINLSSVLIQLSQPFINDISKNSQADLKIRMVDPSYCSTAIYGKKDEIKGMYIADLHTQTPMIPLREDAQEPSVYLKDHFSFMTACFFLTHRALHLGLHVVVQKLNKLSQDLSRIQNHYEEALAQGSPATEMMHKHMESKMTLFLSLKAVAFESEFKENFLRFISASSYWFCQVASKSRSEKVPAAISSHIFENPIPESPDSSLQHIPEFLIENIVGILTSVKRYSAESFFMSGESILNHLMTFIVSFMGQPYWIHNPHLKANLAECLESFIPKENDSSMFASSISQSLFIEHPMANYQAQALIYVFVSIEMTGQSVAFEEKFNYRRPMYEIMKYLWQFPQHRKQFLALANKALSHMDSAETPLFLRFVNFLMNDAIFLLDEGLSYMAQIRESQIERDSEDYLNIPTERRAEDDRNSQQMSMLARFHNLLGSKTIETLCMLTKEISNMFTHPTLVDRMAAMLNHFLVHLVGPKQRNLKVRDMEKYEFRPSDIVVDICKIYINLREYSNFAIAIASDGRSYNPKLFEQASHVLKKIGHHGLNEDILSFSAQVKDASKSVLDDDLVSDAPEEFLDPIMSNIMVDPVTLPSSQIIVDHSTIARHLLSDQTDPFNRQPLTMGDVIRCDDLRKRIQLWVEDKKAERYSS